MHCSNTSSGKIKPLSMGVFSDFLSTLFNHLPPYIFHYVGRCWDRTQDCLRLLHQQ
jgi:hypothetical protein